MTGRTARRSLLARGRGLAGLLWRLAKMELRTNDGRFDLALLRRGFFSSRRAMYPFGAYPAEAFLTDWEIEVRLGVVNPRGWRSLLKDKLAVHALAGALLPSVRMPDVLGVSSSGRAVMRGGATALTAPSIAKPLGGSGGRGVVLLRPGDTPPVAGTHLIERVVEQHGYSRAIFPDALNTVRLYTVCLPGEEPLILGAAHRFGTKRSAPADNFKAGGLVARIDARTGRLSPLVVPTGSERMTSDTHPETGQLVAGVQVPHWQAVLELGKAAAETFRVLPYAGWDIAVAEGGPVLIELNASLANPNLLQMHEPLLADEAARRSLVALGVISAQRAASAEAALAERERP